MDAIPMTDAALPKPELIDLEASDAYAEIQSRFSASGIDILQAVLNHVKRLQARWLILEPEYVDRDYRSEFSAFYSSAYRQVPSTTSRLHFFGAAADELELQTTEAPGLYGVLKHPYLGYVVVRPIKAAPVGRTMLRPADEDKHDVRSLVTETVHLLGCGLTVVGMPFIAQDAHFGVCAHASAWMVAQYHYLRFRNSPHSTPVAFAASQGIGHSQFVFHAQAGVTLPHLRKMLLRARIATIPYPLRNKARSLPAGESVESVACRYLDSGYPLILSGDGHVVTIIGYKRKANWLGKPRITFIVHDDERGPYVSFAESNALKYQPWNELLVPVPAKIWVPADTAEAQAIARADGQLALTVKGPAIDELIRTQALGWRTVAVEATFFKETLKERGARDELVRAYAEIPMSRWVWVVELIEMDEGGKAVGEVLVDTTNHARDMHVLVWRLADEFVRWDPHEGRQAVALDVPPGDVLTPLSEFLAGTWNWSRR